MHPKPLSRPPPQSPHWPALPRYGTGKQAAAAESQVWSSGSAALGGDVGRARKTGAPHWCLWWADSREGQDWSSLDSTLEACCLLPLPGQEPGASGAHLQQVTQSLRVRQRTSEGSNWLPVTWTKQTAPADPHCLCARALIPCTFLPGSSEQKAGQQSPRCSFKKQQRGKIFFSLCSTFTETIIAYLVQ